MLTHEQRCGSKRALSAICDKRGFRISLTACREWKRLYTMLHCGDFTIISEHHKIMHIYEMMLR